MKTKLRSLRPISAFVIMVLILGEQQSLSKETTTKGINMKFGYTILYVKDLEKTIGRFHPN